MNTTKKSLIARLRIFMVVIATSFVLGLIAMYVSSIEYLSGMQTINGANALHVTINQTIESLNVSMASLREIERRKKIKTVKYAFQESSKISIQSLKKSLLLSKKYQDIRPSLLAAESSLLAFNESCLLIFAPGTKKITEETLVAMEYGNESIEHLKKAQLRLRDLSDLEFKSIYDKRFYPLIVMSILSFAFFGFVVLFGFRMSNHITRSISNLTDATTRVKAGDLVYDTPIIEEDEIGNLTEAFNDMVFTIVEKRNVLRQTMNRLGKLQETTAEFSEALTVEQVCEIAMEFGLEGLSASSGLVALIDENDDQLEIVKSYGQNAFMGKNWMDLRQSHPVSDVIRWPNPFFIDSQETLMSKYPHLESELKRAEINSIICIPLKVASTVLGVISFSFKEKATFSQPERDFITSICSQCAQAIHRSRLYDDARDAIRVRDEFLSIASHELRTPLTPLKLQLQMLSREIGKGEKIEVEKLLRIQQNSDYHITRLTKLIEDLLDVSRISMGKLKLNLERINLMKLMKELTSQYGKHFKDTFKHIDFIGDDQVEGNFDRIRLEQVIINLLTNAAKYAPGKPLRIEVSREKNMAQIKIIDQGPGIAKENLERIFDRFERVKGTNNIGGLGLGLYISKQILLAHEGDIWVESEPGKGSTFILKLPLNLTQSKAHEFQL